MTIRRARVHIMTNEVEPEALTALLGFEPSATRDWLTPPGKPPHGKHGFRYTWTFDSTATSDDLADHIDSLVPLLARLAEVHMPADADIKLAVAGDSRDMGWVFAISPEQSALLAAAKCWVWIDVYNPLTPDE